jgi:tetratricopeptide (TPR) repeat protein
VLSIGLAALATAGAFVFGLLRFGWGSGVFLGLAAGLVVLVSLVRRARKPIQAAMDAIEGDVKAQRFDRAIERLRRARRLGLWQPLLTSQIDEQIGVIHYAGLKDPEGARPYLERARHKSVQGWTMLAASAYRRGRHDEAERVLERASRRRPKEGLIWAAYAWCRLSRVRRAEALHVLARGRDILPTDERLRRMQHAVQNGKPARMRAFGADWYTLELERMPPATAPSPSAYHPALRRRRSGARVRMR